MRKMLLLLALCRAIPALGQRSPYNRIHVRTCAVADSLLGPITGNVRGNVRRRYDLLNDSTYLITGTAPGPYATHEEFARVSFSGRGPISYPSPEFHVLIGGLHGRDLLAAPAAPRLSLILDASDTIEVGTPFRGTFLGPPQRAIAPFSAMLLPSWFLDLARARAATVQLGTMHLPLSKHTLEDLAALYRASVCEQNH